MRMIVALVILILLSPVSMVYSKEGNDMEGKKKNPSQVYYEMRNMLLHVNPQEMNLKPSVELPNVYGVVMETGNPNATITLFALAEGTVSLYFENGGGFIGLGTHENVWKKAYDFLKTAERLRNHLKPTKEYPLPSEGRVRFYVLTYDGAFYCDYSEEELSYKNHELFDLYYSGHQVITEVRIMDEQGKFKERIGEK